MNQEPIANEATSAVADSGETPANPAVWNVYVTSLTSTDTSPYAAPAPVASSTHRTMPSRSAPIPPKSSTTPAMIWHAIITAGSGNTTGFACPDASATNTATPSVLAMTATVAVAS